MTTIRITKGLKATYKNARDYTLSQSFLEIEKYTDNYEVLNADYNRMYGDIDGKNIEGSESEFNALDEKTKNAIVSFLKDETYCLMTASSYTHKKISWRFVILNRKCSLKDNKKWVQLSVESIDLPKGITFDTNPYGNNQKMRMVGSNKDGENRPLKLVKGEIIDSLISYIPDECELMQLPTQEEIVSTESHPKLEGKFLHEIVMNIDSDDSYEQWVKIGMAIRSSGGSEELFLKWSQQSASYNEKECHEKWRSFSENSNITTGSLFFWSKQSNPEKHKLILIEHRTSTLWDLITLLNHKDVALYFHTQHPDKYLWNESMGWFLLGHHNVWIQSDKQTPSGLKRHISDAMMSVFLETKKIELKQYTTQSALEDDPKKQELLTTAHKSKMSMLNNAYKILGSDSFCNGVIAFLPSYYEVRDLSTKMNMNRNLFAFTNKVYDLTLGKERDILPTDYISITTGYAYPESSNKQIRAEINTLLYGMFECEDTKMYLLQVLASCLLGNNKFEEFYIFTGSGGNGKGVLNDLLRYVFGDYYISVDVSLFTKPVDKRDQPVPALVEAQYKRVMITTEPEKEDKLQVGLIKKISGNDVVEARTLHSKTIVKYVPQYKTILQANAIPKLNKIDGGVSRRLRVIHFPFKFVDENSIDANKNNRLGDSDVKDKKCRSLEWRNEFCLMLFDTYEKVKHMKVLVQPADVKGATCEYMDDNDPIKTWLESKYTITKSEKDLINATELKQAFLMDTSTEKMSDMDFKAMMSLNNIQSKKTKTCNVYYGLRRNATLDA